MNTLLSDHPLPGTLVESSLPDAIPSSITQAPTDPASRQQHETSSGNRPSEAPTQASPAGEQTPAKNLDPHPEPQHVASVPEQDAVATSQHQPPKFNIGAIGEVEELSPEEFMALLTDEHIIEDEFRASIDIGIALADIRNRRLYRVEYTDFTEYYRRRWHFDPKKVHVLTATAEAYKAITTGPNLPKPEYASQLRPVLPLEPEKARQAWEQAARKAGGRKITMMLVQAAVLELNLRPEAQVKNVEVKRQRAERRQQLSTAMETLLELIIMRKPYEDLVQTAALLDQHLRFFFPKPKKR